MAKGTGTKDDPWQLTTPPGSSEYTMHRHAESSPTLKYHASAIDDLHAWLVEQADWVPLGAADEQKPAADGTVEAWGRSPDNPVGGWERLAEGVRGRLGLCVSP